MTNKSNGHFHDPLIGWGLKGWIASGAWEFRAASPTGANVELWEKITSSLLKLQTERCMYLYRFANSKMAAIFIGKMNRSHLFSVQGQRGSLKRNTLLYGSDQTRPATLNPINQTNFCLSRRKKIVLPSERRRRFPKQLFLGLLFSRKTCTWCTLSAYTTKILSRRLKTVKIRQTSLMKIDWMKCLWVSMT